MKNPRLVPDESSPVKKGKGGSDSRKLGFGIVKSSESQRERDEEVTDLESSNGPLG